MYPQVFGVGKWLKYIYLLLNNILNYFLNQKTIKLYDISNTWIKFLKISRFKKIIITILYFIFDISITGSSTTRPSIKWPISIILIVLTEYHFPRALIEMQIAIKKYKMQINTDKQTVELVLKSNKSDLRLCEWTAIINSITQFQIFSKLINKWKKHRLNKTNTWIS